MNTIGYLKLNLKVCVYDLQYVLALSTDVSFVFSI